MNNSILILDSSQSQADLLKNILESADFGYQCRLAQSLEQAKEMIQTKAVDVLLIDKDLPEERLYPKLQQLKLKNRNVRMIMLAENVEQQELQKAQQHYVEGFCLKGDDYPTLINTIEQVIE